MFKNANDGHLDSIIDTALSDMESHDVTSEEFTTAANNIKTLYEARKNSSSWTPKPEHVLGAATNLIGIFAILKHEELNVITSKAIGLITKVKL